MQFEIKRPVVTDVIKTDFLAGFISKHWGIKAPSYMLLDLFNNWDFDVYIEDLTEVLLKRHWSLQEIRKLEIYSIYEEYWEYVENLTKEWFSSLPEYQQICPFATNEKVYIPKLDQYGIVTEETFKEQYADFGRASIVIDDTYLTVNWEDIEKIEVKDV